MVRTLVGLAVAQGFNKLLLPVGASRSFGAVAGASCGTLWIACLPTGLGPLWRPHGPTVLVLKDVGYYYNYYRRNYPKKASRGEKQKLDPQPFRLSN